MTSKDKVKFITMLLGDYKPECFTLRQFRDDILKDLDKLVDLIIIFKKYIYVEERDKYYIETKSFNVLEEKEFNFLKELLKKW